MVGVLFAYIARGMRKRIRERELVHNEGKNADSLNKLTLICDKSLNVSLLQKKVVSYETPKNTLCGAIFCDWFPVYSNNPVAVRLDSNDHREKIKQMCGFFFIRTFIYHNIQHTQIQCRANTACDAYNTALIKFIETQNETCR